MEPILTAKDPDWALAHYHDEFLDYFYSHMENLKEPLGAFKPYKTRNPDFEPYDQFDGAETSLAWLDDQIDSLQDTYTPDDGKFRFADTAQGKAERLIESVTYLNYSRSYSAIQKDLDRASKTMDEKIRQGIEKAMDLAKEVCRELDIPTGHFKVSFKHDDGKAHYPRLAIDGKHFDL